MLTMGWSAALVLLLMLTAAVNPQNAALQRPGEAILQGIVVYPDGRPAAGAIVSAIRDDMPEGISIPAISKADGSFSLFHLLPRITYSICASKMEGGYLSPSGMPMGIPLEGRCEKVVLKPDQTLTGLVVRLATKGGRLQGRLVDASTQRPVRGGKVTLYRVLKLEGRAWVWAKREEAGWIPEETRRTDRNGVFEFSYYLAPGDYLLSVKAPGYNQWYFEGQASEASAQRLLIKSGQTTEIVALLERSVRR